MAKLEAKAAGNIEAPELAAEKLTELLEAIGTAPEDTGVTTTITGEDPFVASPHRIGTTTAVALSAIGAATAAIWKMRIEDNTISSSQGTMAQRVPIRGRATAGRGGVRISRRRRPRYERRSSSAGRAKYRQATSTTRSSTS